MHWKNYLSILLSVAALSSCAKSIDLSTRYDEGSRTLYLGDYAIPGIIDKKTGVAYLGKENSIRMDQETYVSRDTVCYAVRVIKMTTPPHDRFNKPVHELLAQHHPGTCSTERTANVHFTRCMVERRASRTDPFPERRYMYYVSIGDADANDSGKRLYRLPDAQCMQVVREHIRRR